MKKRDTFIIDFCVEVVFSGINSPTWRCFLICIFVKNENRGSPRSGKSQIKFANFARSTKSSQNLHNLRVLAPKVSGHRPSYPSTWHTSRCPHRLKISVWMVFYAAFSVNCELLFPIYLHRTIVFGAILSFFSVGSKVDLLLRFWTKTITIDRNKGLIA
jgi:hypothetical protein